VNPNSEKNYQDCQIIFGEVFIPEKTSDRFLEVKFIYSDEDYEWYGALPIVGSYQGLALTEAEVKETAGVFCESLKKENRQKWIKTALEEWEDKKSETFKVFDALLSGEWECRVCGPVPKVNTQPAARIRDIKKRGFFVASKRKDCRNCQKKTMYDLLVMATSPKDLIKIEFRKPISQHLNERILKVLKRKETVFNQVRTSRELVIDHKFPSQRWLRPETDNNDDMSDEDIRKKFQLLNNQTNLLKSRECDRCVAEGIRGQFMGIRWYYIGNEKWVAEKDDENGCIGCPWYDVGEWKEQLRKAIKKSSIGHLDEGD
jgi:rubrerythrin